MTRLSPKHVTTSGLDPAYSAVSSIDIADAAMGGGGFGTIHACERVNDVSPAAPLVIKLLRDDRTGSHLRGFQMIRELQARIEQASVTRDRRGDPPLSDVPALSALPLFAFEATHRGVDVLGYAMRRLDTAGYHPFESLVDGSDPDLRRQYLSCPEHVRLGMAAQLAQGFQVLHEELDCIHADLNPPNLWVNLTAGKIAIIDLDGGAVLSDPNAQTTTFGKLGEWLAPEISSQLAQQGPTIPVSVDQRAEAWSVMVGICHLIYLVHPLFYLERLAPTSVRSYLAHQRWPEIDPSDSNFSRDNADAYRWYRQQVKLLPGDLMQLFSATVNDGFFDPNCRATPREWYCALTSQFSPPEIIGFEADPALILPGTPVTLRWWVQRARSVNIDGGVGDVSSVHSVTICPCRSMTYTLTARGMAGESSATCTIDVLPLPAVAAVRPPSPQAVFLPVSPQITARPVSIHLPRIRLDFSLPTLAPRRKSPARFGAARFVLPYSPLQAVLRAISTNIQSLLLK